MLLDHSPLSLPKRTVARANPSRRPRAVPESVIPKNVLAKEIANHVQGEVTGEVKYRVIEQVGDKLFHRDTSRGQLGKKDSVAHIADKLAAQGLRTID